MALDTSGCWDRVCTPRSILDIPRIGFADKFSSTGHYRRIRGRRISPEILGCLPSAVGAIIINSVSASLLLSREGWQTVGPTICTSTLGLPETHTWNRELPVNPQVGVSHIRTRRFGRSKGGYLALHSYLFTHSYSRYYTEFQFAILPTGPSRRWKVYFWLLTWNTRLDWHFGLVYEIKMWYLHIYPWWPITIWKQFYKRQFNFCIIFQFREILVLI